MTNKILQIADRPGWAIDRLSKPLSLLIPDCDMCYFYDKESRFLASGYTEFNDRVIGVGKRDLSTYDIVHIHREEAARSVLGLCSQARKIVTKHTERDEGTHWDLFDDIICPTVYCWEQMRARYSGKRVHFVPHSIDLDQYYYEFEPYDKRTIGYAGRIVPWKRWDVLLKACKEARFKVNGVGYIEDVKTFHNHNSLKGVDFEFVSFLPERQMRKFYNKQMMFVSISKPHIEVGPLPVLEAMACGCPVVSTRTGWAVDWGIFGSNIWYIDEDEIHKLGQILNNLADRPEILGKLRDNGMRLVQNFSLEKYAERLKKIYDDPAFISTPDIIRKEIYV